MITAQKTLCALLALLFIFCINIAQAFEVKYELNGIDTPDAPVKINKSIAVLVFKDIRPEIERSAYARSEALVSESTYYTEDEPYTIDRGKSTATVEQQISKAIAKHFDFCGLFKKATYLNIRDFDVSKNKKLLEEIIRDTSHFPQPT